MASETLLCLDPSILALTICVLVSCRTSSESSYSLLNIDQKLLKQTLGDQCYESTEDFRPDAYRIGLSESKRELRDAKAMGHESAGYLS
ncbi:hypothetical protein ISF_08102 [Cordyceps fumosorosea ARSEF 2679]|uniref:Uncharacterized protein n=1 Tax=Cordyceps fumosorosea (strain ARSEF 2679) TaxID=1081104 RepID=A0A167N6B5_CORFA|nr:hypothetical protein ISF_08102 [Cordyceps fumosorosea ARSEF 2679]OAA55181.1 hypothetical protein ISF_08102 [Cordyceps fumosorosea ARSEF 2679]